MLRIVRRCLLSSRKMLSTRLCTRRRLPKERRHIVGEQKSAMFTPGVERRLNLFRRPDLDPFAGL